MHNDDDGDDDGDDGPLSPVPVTGRGPWSGTN